MDKHEKFIKLTTGRIERLVCEFAVPSIICMVISALYNIIDTYFVGKINTQSTAALGIVFSYMTMIQAVSFFFGHGSGNFISRALGAQKTDEAATMGATGFFSALITSSIIAILCGIFIEPVLYIFGSTPTIMPYAKEYFMYILLGTPFISGVFAMNNQMRLQGNAAMSAIGIMTGAILNIILDPILIFKFNMGISGAGLATAISQFVSFVIMLKMIGKNGGIAIKLQNFRPTVGRFAEIFAGGSPSLLRQCLMGVASIFLNNYASQYGDTAVAAFSVATRVMMFSTAVLLGFGQGYQPVCGFNFGAKLFDRVNYGFRFSTIVATIYCFIFSIVGIIFAHEIVTIFSSNDAEVIEIGTIVLKYHCYSFTLNGFIILANMYLQNTRRTTSAIILATARQGLFFVPVLCLCANCGGLYGIIISQPISDILTFIVAIPLCKKAMREAQ